MILVPRIQKFLVRVCLSVFILVLFAAEQACAQTQKTNLNYHVFVHGLHVLNVKTSYSLSNEQYDVTMSMNTSGLLNWFLKTNMTMEARGRFSGLMAQPEIFDMNRQTDKKSDEKHIIYKNQVPEVQLAGDVTAEDLKEIPTEQERRGALDSMSLLMQILHQFRTTNGCQGDAKVFDGSRHLSIFRSASAGEQKIPSGGPFRWGKRGMRCDFVWQVIKSFKENGEPEVLDKSQPGSIWFEKIGDAGFVAIRLELETLSMGHVSMLLNKTPAYQP